MKRAIAWLLSPPLFWLGHVVSLCIRWDSLAFLYPIYNTLMGWSCRVEDWAGTPVMWGAPCEDTER